MISQELLLIYVLIGLSYIVIDWYYYERKKENYSTKYLLISRTLAVLAWPIFVFIEWIIMMKKLFNNHDN